MSALQLSEIDYPPCWLDPHTLRATASGCFLTDDMPGDFEVWLGRAQMTELLEAYCRGFNPSFEGVLLRADLSEAADDFIAMCPGPEHLRDWALHLEMLAAKLREAAHD